MRREDLRSETMTIGELAREAGVGVQTVRYYERRRLLPTASRRASGYREFTRGALERLRFIRRAQELGFTLAEIAELLALRLDPHTTAADVKARAEQKIEEIDRRIHDLERIRGGVVFFQPLGGSAHHVVQLRQALFEREFTLEVLPLTGEIRMHDGLFTRDQVDEGDFR